MARDLALAGGVVVLATWVRYLLAPILQDRAAFMLLTLAVMFSAWLRGWQMGIFVTFLSSVIGGWLLVPPFDRVSPANIQDVVEAILFLVTGCGISLLAGQLQRSRSAANREAAKAKETRDEISELVESIGEGFQAFDQEFRLLYINRAAERIAGRASSAGNPVWCGFPADVSTELQQQLREVMRQRSPVTSEHFDEARQRWFLVGIYPFRSGVSVLSRDITKRKLAERECERLLRELQSARGHLQTLGGLIPICAWCKKIRNDQGYWQQLEAYLSEHSEADFSHGMCPDCVKELSKEIPQAS